MDFTTDPNDMFEPRPNYTALIQELLKEVKSITAHLETIDQRLDDMVDQHGKVRVSKE